MKFYLCQTGDGPLFARTQADAKALDKNFETVNLDTDQAALVDRFNERFEQGKAYGGGKPASVLVEGPDDAGLVWSEPEGAPEKAKKSSEPTSLTDWGRAPPPGSCERCTAMSQSARHIEGIMAITNIEWTLGFFDEAALQRVEAAIAERRGEFA